MVMNMNHVLYEVSSKYELLFFIPYIVMFLIAIFLLIRYKLDDNENLQNNIIFKRFIGGFVCLAVFSIFGLLGQIHMYNKIVKAYEQGNYQTVEGYVENFDPMPHEGHKHESFDINGVSFSYSDFAIQPGYHNAKSHGGVITGNGQHLKIGYVYYNSAEGNIIVYIEKLD